MKEASGELSMTAVAIVAIAAVGVVFTTFVWPAIKSNLEHNTQCASAVNCSQASSGSDTYSCQYWDSDSGSYTNITCSSSQLGDSTTK